MTVYELVNASLAYLPSVAPLLMALAAVSFADLVVDFLVKLVKQARRDYR